MATVSTIALLLLPIGMRSLAAGLAFIERAAPERLRQTAARLEVGERV